MRPARRLLLATVLALMPLHAMPALAQPSGSVTATLDPARIETLPAFIDGVMAQQIASREVSGALVTVVHQGEVVMSRGYGFADVENRVPVDGQSTLFRPGSISKMFTWVALMQLVEQGRVSLDDDVNAHIDFEIEPFNGEPITVRDLLQHTPGMSDVGGFTTTDPQALIDHAEWTRTHVPARVRAPGEEVAYSNWGTSLAGYIVEQVSGEHFADYVEAHIFQPLGMTSSTFREPLPQALADRIALGHDLENGRFTARTFDYYSMVMPAGSATVSGPDMARFMMAMLNDGALGEARILSAESVALLESNSITNAPRLPGMAHGYLVYREEGPRLIGHAGAMRDFRSNMILSPETQTGVFLSIVAAPAGRPAQGELSAAITGRLFPQEPSPRWTEQAEAGNFEGRYLVNRRDYSTEPHPLMHAVVRAVGDNALTIEAIGQTLYFEQIGPGLFEQATGLREGGPFDQVEFYGSGEDLRLSFASQPFMNWHYAGPLEGGEDDSEADE
ncbi:MAG: serine hydrolase domain-containing protein [Caulobacterales bacterium]|uniref:serine hydrolase domain-containing protein n=1 Tax=Glycocaulis sp. TaxID=1969725 RepID=UPI003F9EBED8